jgi:5-methylcytosine-specific restriction endonuclease McrA
MADPYWCEHPETALRWRVNKAGAGAWVRQCQTCGWQVGTAIRRDAPEVRQRHDRPLFDESIRERYEDLRRARIQRQQQIAELEQERKHREWWAWYNRYLTTAEWKARRALVLKRAGGLCEGCREARAQQVHHLTYAHVGDEFLFELVALCSECHERLHEEKAAS